MHLLELLCKSPNGLAIPQLSEITGLHKSTVHRLLAAMASRGYVRRDPESAVYRAGMRLCELSEYIQENLDVVARAREPMERLSRTTGETVHLVAREGAEIVYVYKVESIHGAIRMVSRIGMRRPLYCTGVGKAILATRGDEEVLRCWEESERVPWHPLHHHPEGRLSAGDQPDPAARLWPWTMRRTSWGCGAWRAAIPDWHGVASYALSISAPVSRMTDERVQSLIPALLETRDEISACLGGRPE